MFGLTAVHVPVIPRVGEGDPTPLFEATAAAMIAETGRDPRKLLASPPGSAKCHCEWPGHRIYNTSEGKGGRIGSAHHT